MFPYFNSSPSLTFVPGFPQNKAQFKTDVKCPACGHVYRIDASKDLLLSIMTFVDKTVQAVVPYITLAGVSMAFFVVSTTFGAYAVMTVCGPDEGERLLSEPNWAGGLGYIGLPLIPIVLVCSRLSVPDAVLPLLPFIVIGNDRIKLTFPPSPALKVCLLLFARFLYNGLWMFVRPLLERGTVTGGGQRGSVHGIGAGNREARDGGVVGEEENEFSLGRKTCLGLLAITRKTLRARCTGDTPGLHVLAHGINEVDITARSQALVINIGRLSEAWIDSMHTAAKKAGAKISELKGKNKQGLEQMVKQYQGPADESTAGISGLAGMWVLTVFIENAPRTIKTFINRPQTPSFDEADSIEISAKDYESNGIIPLRFVKYQSVHSLMIFVEDNLSGSGETALKQIILYGTPVKTTKMSDLKKGGHDHGSDSK
ncbi:hypothetical protein HK104_001605 [Borealophlyctis nickersoniae]|nr:hypothetical protein HK104_001605 [Borealophlyctis nickersoniae]